MQRTLTAAAKVVEDYCLMFNVPNTATGNQNELAGGGFASFAGHGDTQSTRTFAAFDNSQNSLGAQVNAAMFWNGSYAACATQLNQSQINGTFSGVPYDGARAMSFVQDRTDKVVKFYNRPYSGAEAGISVPSGYGFTNRQTYRVLKR